MDFGIGHWGRAVRARPPDCVAVVSSQGFSLGCHVAWTFFDRLKGLLGTGPGSHLEKGLVLTDCASIHTNGMSYPIDVAFIDKNPYTAPVESDGGAAPYGVARVMAAYRHVLPGSVVSCPGARAVIERESRPDGVWMQAGGRVFYRFLAGDSVESCAVEGGPADSSSTQISEHNMAQVL